MKKLTMMALTGLVLMALAAPVLALGPVDVGAGLDINSKYVWRGMVANPEYVLQPSVEASAFGFTAGFWGNIDSNDINDRKLEFSEVDWTLGYGLSLPVLEINAGLINYTFPGVKDPDTDEKVPSTTELYLGAALSVPLSPSVTIYYDIDQIKGGYWELGVSHGLTLNPTMGLDLSAGVGLGSRSYIFGYFGVLPTLPATPDVAGLAVDASMTDYHVSAGVPFNFIPMFTVTPSVTYSALVGDVKDIVDPEDTDSDALILGLSASFSF